MVIVIFNKYTNYIPLKMFQLCKLAMALRTVKGALVMV